MATANNDESRELPRFEIEAALDEIEYSLEHIKGELKYARRYLKRLAK